MNRELDGQIAEEVFGWVLVPVGPDAGGEGNCEILAPHKDMPQEWYNRLPLKGKIHRAFDTPQYSSNMTHAINLCIRVGYNPDIKLYDVLKLKPEELAQKALDLHRAKKTC